MLSERCPVLPVRPVCNVGVSWSNGWMDQDETWHGGRPRPPKGVQPPIFEEEEDEDEEEDEKEDFAAKG